MGQLEERLASSNQRLNEFVERIMSKVEFLVRVQQLILGHFQDYSCLGFYSVTVLGAWLATGFKALRTSRVICMALIAGSLAVERTLNSHLDPEHAMASSIVVRCLLTVTLSGFLLYRRATYVNLTEESNRLLKLMVEAERTPAWFHKYKPPQPSLPAPKLLFHEPPRSTVSTSHSTLSTSQSTYRQPLVTPLKRARATAEASYLNSA